MRTLVLYLFLMVIIAPLSYLVGWIILSLAFILYPAIHYGHKACRATIWVGEPLVRGVIATM